MIKISEILESYWDDEGTIGFRDSSYDKIKIHVKYLCGKFENSLLKDTKTGIYYISYDENIDSSYQEGIYYSYADRDEDGGYVSYEFDEDNAEITDNSIALFVQMEIDKNSVTENVEAFQNGATNEQVLRITKDNKSDVYTHFSDLIKEFFSEKYKK